MRSLVTVLGMPQNRFASIHVVGSNGKSSAARAAAALLDAHGVASGAYLSPHVERWTERILIGGGEISDEVFATAIGRVAEAVETVDRTLEEGDAVTQFEVVTAAAFVAFAGAGVEVGRDRGRPRWPARRDQRDSLAGRRDAVDLASSTRIFSARRRSRSPPRSWQCSATTPRW